MSRNAGRRGTAAEHAVRDDLLARGYDVIRSAGSKGAADLTAVHDQELLFVQVKLGRQNGPFAMPTPAERQELLRIARRITGARAVAATRVPGDRWNVAGVEYRILTGAGPRDWARFSPREVLPS